MGCEGVVLRDKQIQSVESERDRQTYLQLLSLEWLNRVYKVIFVFLE